MKLLAAYTTALTLTALGAAYITYRVLTRLLERRDTWITSAMGDL